MFSIFSKKIPLILSAVAFVCFAYAIEVSNFYIGYYDKIKGEEVKSFKSNSEEICNTQNGYCNKNYTISLNELKALEAKYQNSYLNAGQILLASKWTCGEINLFTTGDEFNLAKNPDGFNRFNIFKMSTFSPCKHDIDVRFFYFKGQKKYAITSGNLTVNNADNSIAIKKINDFIMQDFKTLNLCALLAVLLFSIFIRIVAIDNSSKDRAKLSMLLAFGAMAQSGLLEVWFPFSFMPDLNRWFAALGYCAYVSFGFKYLSKNIKLSKFIEPVALILFVILLATTQSRVSTWIYFSGAMSSVYLFFGLYLKNIQVVFCGVLLTLATLEFLGFKNMPNSYTVPAFFAILIISENQKAFLSYLKINRLLKMSRLRGSDVTLRKENSNRVHSIVKIFQKQFNTKKVTVLNLADIQMIRIMQYDSKSALPNVIEMNELPPIFAHVVSTGNALINVHEDSNVVASFRRGENKQNFNSQHFTILPLFSGKETIGAIALTEYDHQQFESSLNYATFIFCLDILRGLLVEHLLTTPKTDSLNKIKKFFEYVNATPVIGKVTVDSEMSFFADAMTHVFGWRVLSGRINPSDNLILINKVNNFDEGIKKQVLSGKIYAHKDNKQGPLALAVHEVKPVIVPNTKWLQGVVHENTIKFFNIHATKTAAFIPVVQEIGQNAKKVIGVYWIEGVRGNEITYSDRELFLSMMKTISDRLQRIDSAEELDRSRASLAQFVPKHLVDAVMRGEPAVEKDYGYLLMFDLKGSTRLAHKITNESFRESVAILKEKMNQLLLNEGWILQQFEWDAFYFTQSVNTSASTKLSIESVHHAINGVFNDWQCKLIEQFGKSTEVDTLSYRICFTCGDTSRGVVQEGATQTWTFTGNAIATVSKVENESKKLVGQVFADDSMLDVSMETAWIRLQSTPHGFSVYGLGEAEVILKKAA